MYFNIVRIFSIFTIVIQPNTSLDYTPKIYNFLTNLERKPDGLTSFLKFTDLNEQIQLSSFLSTKHIRHNFLNKDMIDLMDRTFEANHLFIIDLKESFSMEILNQVIAFNLKLIYDPKLWLIITEDASSLNQFYFSANTQIYIISKMELSLIYKITDDGQDFNRVKIGQWTGYNFTRTYAENPIRIKRERTNIQKSPIRITHVFTNNDSLNHLYDYRNKRVDAVSKVNFLLMRHVIEMLNATALTRIEQTWGYLNRTSGKYDGLMGLMQNNETDLGGTPLFITADRLEFISYIGMTVPTTMAFIFRAPPLSYITNVFTLPFDTQVWHYSFAMVALIAIVIYIIVVWEHYEDTFESIEGGTRSLEPDIFDVIMMTLGAVSQQGSDGEPQSNSGRIATIVSFLVLMFLYTSYSANIVALLQSTTDSIRTPSDLLHSRIELGAEDIVYLHFYFSHFQEPVRKAIYTKKIIPKDEKTDHFLPAELGIRKVRDEFYGFHLELNTGYRLIGEMFLDSQKCALQEVKVIDFFDPYVSMRKWYQNKEALKIALLKLSLSGIRQREYNRIYTVKPQCHTRANSFSSVGLMDCYAAFVFFAVGIMGALIFLVLETIFLRIKTIYRQPTN